MDALLSLPALSLLLVPAYGSYGTSLNLLFFYLTWSTLLLSHPPLKVELVSTLFVRLLFYLAPSLLFLAFDAALPGLAVGIKHHGARALPVPQRPPPTRARRAVPSSATAAASNGGRWWRVALVGTLNVGLGVAVQTAIGYLFTHLLHIRSALKVTATLPLPGDILKDLLRGFASREVLTYVLHRYVLHARASPLAPLHASWYHTLRAPFPLTATYDHPLAYLVRSFLPTYIPAALFRFHLLTYLLYLALVSLEELFVYSGYSVLPSGFVLGGMARRVEGHLLAGGEGNYGACGLLDLLAGTGVGGGDLLEDVVDEAERRDVPGRVGRKVGRKVGRARRRVEEYADE